MSQTEKHNVTGPHLVTQYPLWGTYSIYSLIPLWRLDHQGNNKTTKFGLFSLTAGQLLALGGLIQQVWKWVWRIWAQSEPKWHQKWSRYRLQRLVAQAQCGKTDHRNSLCPVTGPNPRARRISENKTVQSDLWLISLGLISSSHPK